MKIIGAYLGDGSSRVKRLYRGEDIIYDNQVEPELYIASVYDRYGIANCGYIPVLDQGELYTNYKYEIDCVIPVRPLGYASCFIGGSWNIRSEYPSYPGDTPNGLFICSTRFDRYNSSKGYLTGLVVLNIGYGSSWTESRIFGQNDLTDYYATRNVFTVVNRNFTPPSGPSGDVKRGTSGGFFLLNAMDYRTANTPMINSGLITDNCTKVYRISIYDENDDLIMNFLPKIVNNHKGMLETLSNTFYPCSDDSKFTVEADTPLVRRRSVPNKFDGKTKLYFGTQEIPKMQIQDKYFWNKYNFDINKFEIVEEEE